MFEGFADTPEAKLWYWDTGGDGEAIVLCHPASQGCHIWERQRDAFVAAGYRVIGYARRGYDRSETGEPEQPGTSIGDLENLLDIVGVDQVHLLGAAAGGITATGFSVVHGHRTRSLILAGTIVAPAEAEWRTMFARLGIAALHDHVPTEFLELGPTYRASNPEGTARFGELSTLARTARTQKQPLGVEVT